MSKHPKNLFHCAFPVSLKQHFQSFDIFQNLFSGVGVAYHQPFSLRFDQFRSGFDVFIFGQCGIDALEWLVGFDADTVRIEDQRVSGDTGCFVLAFAESAVDHHQTAVCTYRVFPSGGAYRGVSIDDM